MAATNLPLNTLVSTVNTLTRTTYEQWCYKVKIELGNDLYRIVTDATTEPAADATAAARTTWEKKNRDAMRIIIPSIVEPEFQLIRNCLTARDIWEVLESNFRDVSMLR